MAACGSKQARSIPCRGRLPCGIAILLLMLHGSSSSSVTVNTSSIPAQLNGITLKVAVPNYNYYPDHYTVDSGGAPKELGSPIGAVTTPALKGKSILAPLLCSRNRCCELTRVVKNRKVNLKQ